MHNFKYIGLYNNAWYNYRIQLVVLSFSNLCIIITLYLCLGHATCTISGLITPRYVAICLELDCHV